MHKVTVFQCDHCKRINSSQRNMRRHERKCYFDPANQSCAMCKHLETITSDYDVFVGNGEVYSRSCEVPWCAAKEEQLNPLQTKCDKWAALPNGGASAFFVQQAQPAI